MKKDSDVKSDSAKQESEKPTHANVRFTLEELYMLIGGVAHLASYLRDHCGTNAHRLKSRQYDALVKRLDSEYVSLGAQQGIFDSDKTQRWTVDTKWRLAE